MKKTAVGILMGGRSPEHEVSLVSGRNIANGFDPERYQIHLIGISKDGRWYHYPTEELLQYLESSPADAALPTPKPEWELAAVPGRDSAQLIYTNNPQKALSLDVIFPAMHGTFAEDGTVQGLLELLNLPYVGSGVLGSSVGMDKDVCKRLFLQAGIPTARFRTLYKHRKKEIDFDSIASELGLPLFIKPARMGSSVGVHKVRDKREFEVALDDAFQYDEKLLVEEAIDGREIECSVLGNEEPRASKLGEIIPQSDEFYSYQAKYIDENGAILEIPARVSAEVERAARELAIKTYRTLECSGMARVDFFLTKGEKLLVNEVNTIPGFTRISMYPKLWEATGLTYSELLDELIKLAIERFKRERSLKRERL